MVSPSISSNGCINDNGVYVLFAAAETDNSALTIDTETVRYEDCSVTDATSGSDSSMTTPSYYERLLDTWPRQKVPLEVFNAFMELYRRAIR